MATAIEEILAFCRAAQAGDVMDAEELLEEHPQLTEEPTVAAMLGEDQDLARLLDADPTAASQELRPGLTPLFLCCLSQYGGVDEDWPRRWLHCVELLIDHGAAIDQGPADDGQLGGRSSPLLAAVSSLGHAPLCRLLLERGAQATVPAALVAAAALQRWDCLELLRRHGADWNARREPQEETPLQRLLDQGGLSPESLKRVLQAGADPRLSAGPLAETALHIACRRRRVDWIAPLIEHGAQVDALTVGGLSPWRHGLRRGFPEIAAELERWGADTTLCSADELALALWKNELDRAWELLLAEPDLGTSGPPEERRLLADLAAMNNTAAVAALLDAGWELDARGLEGGTALHCACWFAAEESARLLVERGAPLELRGDVHDCTPLGWVAHGSTASGGAEDRAEAYARLAQLLLTSGARLPGPEETHDKQQFAGACDAVRAVLAAHGWSDSGAH